MGAFMQSLEKSIRVAHFIPQFSTLSETFIYQLVSGLSKRFPQTRVCTLERLNAESRPFAQTDLLTLGRAWDFAGKFQDRGRNIQRWLFNKAFRSYLHRSRPDLVHAHFGGSFLRIVDECRALNIPIIVTFRGYDASARLGNPSWRNSYVEKIPKASAIVSVSEDIKRRMSCLLTDNVCSKVIHSGKDPAQYRMELKSGAVDTLLSVGRLVEKKGHEDAVRALAIARQAGFKGTLRIVGDGHLREPLEKLVASLDLSQSVRFLGAMSHEGVLREYAGADAFLLTCKTAKTGDKEGIPNTLKEAMLYGLPIISTIHAGIPELVPSDCHEWLVEEGDWKTAGALILRLAEMNDAQRHHFSQRYRAQVERHFSLETEIDKYAELYAQVVGGHDSKLVPS